MIRYNSDDPNTTHNYINRHGGSIASKLFRIVSNLHRSGVSRPLEEFEYHSPSHNFTGPGTLYNKYKNVTPYNNIDACSKRHDALYSAAFENKDPIARSQMIRRADEEALRCYKQFPNQKGYSTAEFFIRNKINVENINPTIIKKLFGKEYVGR
jgi:hypothetical protein